MLRFMCLVVSLACIAAASAQTPAFDPRAWKGSRAGPPTRVLTVGTAHLAGLPVPVDHTMTSLLLDKLSAFEPDIITVEVVSGEQCDTLKRYAGSYPDSFKVWCTNVESAQHVSGMDAPAAAAEIHETLSSWPKDPTAAARRRLTKLFLATGDVASALVQWRRLPANEQVISEGLSDEALKLLDRLGARHDEVNEIAVALAVRRGLERIYPVDDHTSDAVLIDEGPEFDAAQQAAWRVAPSKALAHERDLEKTLKTPTDVLNLFRFINQPGTLKQNIESDFRASLSQNTPGLYGRHYVSSWEVRNLRMVANICATFGSRPGARVLNIVGNSHKAYYDAYLNLMHDVELVDTQAVLR